MIKVIKNYTKKVLNLLNLNLKFLANKKELREFIKLFKPYNCGYELIRFGDNSDGGYLLPNCLDDVDYCFSPGVGNNVGFEKNILNKGISTFFLDYTINNFNFEIEKYESFTQKKLNIYNDEKNITLETWMNNSLSNKNKKNDLILQMDIEGSEWNILNQTSNNFLKNYRIMIIEFHYLDEISSKFIIQKFSDTLKKILKDFTVVHIHPNNEMEPFNYRDYEIPRALEVTFLRNDFVKQKHKIEKLPHYLDYKNIVSKKDFLLPKYWY